MSAAPEPADRSALVGPAAARVAGATAASSVVRLTGGASRETWSVDLVVDGRVVGAVARIALDDARGVPLATEAAAITAAAATGTPVPEVLGVGAVPELGGTLMVMRRVPGETIARRILRDEQHAGARAGLARALGAAAARVHAAAPPDVVAATPGHPVDLLVADLGGPAPPPPGLALGLRWLREHAPARRDPVLVHGDLRLGNVVVDPDGLAALLDWELVHVGDPLEDLGWLCAKVWRFGAASPVGGLGSREDLLDGYAGVAGWRPGLDELRWWELWGTVRWGLMCGVMAERHLSGVERSVELVAIGRRACEQEHDVLLELGHVAVGDGVPAASAGSAGPAGAAGGVHGRPTALDLLGGVRDYLEAGPMRLPGAAGFEARVARGVLDTVVRELAATDDERAHARLLAGLGCRDDADLARAVEHGTHDDRSREGAIAFAEKRPPVWTGR